MSDVERLLERQARWQRSRQGMSWPEKIRLAERMRPSIEILRPHSTRQSDEATSPGLPKDQRSTEET